MRNLNLGYFVYVRNLLDIKALLRFSARVSYPIAVIDIHKLMPDELWDRFIKCELPWEDVFTEDLRYTVFHSSPFTNTILIDPYFMPDGDLEYVDFLTVKYADPTESLVYTETDFAPSVCFDLFMFNKNGLTLKMFNTMDVFRNNWKEVRAYFNVRKEDYDTDFSASVAAMMHFVDIKHIVANKIDYDSMYSGVHRLRGLRYVSLV